MENVLNRLGLADVNDGVFCGDWRGDGAKIDKISPIDGQRLASVRTASDENYQKAIARAQEAFLKWRITPGPIRGETVRRLGNALRELKHELGQLVTLETGKIIAEGEGGDNHFRGEWLQRLRKICDENDMLLIFDEVQCGMGVTGRTWCCRHFDVVPDLLAFGKKAQVCGVMAGPRLDEVKDNAFRLPSRLNSTWGGNFTDMVRSTHFMRIVDEEHLIENAGKVGAYFLDRLRELQTEFDFIKAVRGRGLFLAFDLPDAKTREEMWKGLFDLGVLALRSGEESIRFRPALDTAAQAVDEAIGLMRKQCQRMRR